MSNHNEAEAPSEERKAPNAGCLALQSGEEVTAGQLSTIGVTSMKPEFINYLESIGIKAGAHLDRIESIHRFYSELCPDEIMDIFVTNYIDSSGKREYEDLWCFSDRYIMDAKGFTAGVDVFVIAPIKGRVTDLRIRKQNYDFKEATDKSRLHLTFRTDTAATANLKASEENCDALRDIILKHVMPNMKR